MRALQMRLPDNWCYGILLLAILAPAEAQVVRVELHPLQSETMTDRQFLQGAQQGDPVTLAGELRIPRGRTDRLPVVVLLHGSGGVSGYVDDWARWLNDMGVATFLVDAFAGRGLSTVLDDQFQLGRLAMIGDTYRALALLEKHPRVDPGRIAVMGFSRGGQAALYASLRRFQRLHRHSDAVPVAYIAFYPDCSTRYRADDAVAAAPIRIFHGVADDYNPVHACRRYVERLRTAGADVQLTEYAGAHHAFDWPYLQVPARLARAQTVRGCRLEEDAGGRILNAETRREFADDDPCLDRGTTVAYDAGAHADAQERVRAILSAVFKLQ